MADKNRTMNQLGLCAYKYHHHLRFNVRFSTHVTSVRTRAQILHVEHELDGSPHNCESTGANFTSDALMTHDLVLGGESSHWIKRQLTRQRE